MLLQILLYSTLVFAVTPCQYELLGKQDIDRINEIYNSDFPVLGVIREWATFTEKDVQDLVSKFESYLVRIQSQIREPDRPTVMSPFYPATERALDQSMHLLVLFADRFSGFESNSSVLFQMKTTSNRIKGLIFEGLILDHMRANVEAPLIENLDHKMWFQLAKGQHPQSREKAYVELLKRRKPIQVRNLNFEIDGLFWSEDGYLNVVEIKSNYIEHQFASDLSATVLNSDQWTDINYFLEKVTKQQAAIADLFEPERIRFILVLCYDVPPEIKQQLYATGWDVVVSCTLPQEGLKQDGSQYEKR